MKNFRLVILSFLSLVLAFGTLSGAVYNQQGDFSVKVDLLKKELYNDNIEGRFSFIVTNNLNSKQLFNLDLPSKLGWDIVSSENSFNLNPMESREVTLILKVNKNFDYSSDVISPDTIQIVQKDEFRGFFDFPVIIKGISEKISLRFNLDIKKRAIDFKTDISSEDLSPIEPLKYSISGQNLKGVSEVFVRVEIGNLILNDFSTSFSNDKNTRFFEQAISSKVAPGEYNIKLTLRVPQDDGKSIVEWKDSLNLNVVEYKMINSNLIEDFSFFNDKYIISLKNNGNINSFFEKSYSIGTFKSFLVSSDFDYSRNSGNIDFRIPLDKGEEKVLVYSINYVPVYLFLILILGILTHIYLRKMANPIKCENKILEIRKVVLEGVKSMKIRVSFENIKEDEIDDLKINFRMPAYLNIKDNSFSLTEPNHVLKGKKQYKLIWNFRRFEKGDTRILSFILINSRGILGDIKLPDLEFEVRIDGKVRKYYKAFPVIKG